MKTEEIKHLIEPILTEHHLFLVELKISKDNVIEVFVDARHQEKVELRLLGVAEKEVLADMDSQDLVCAGAGIDGERGLMVKAHVGNI